MNKKFYFIFYLYLDWDRFYQRGFIEALAKKISPSKIICIERPADLIVGILKKRKRFIDSMPGRNIKKISHNLILIRPFYLLNDYLASWIPGLNRIQSNWLRAFLNLIGLGPQAGEKVVIWLYSAIHWPFAKLYPSSFTIYQPIDEYSLTVQGDIRLHYVKMKNKMFRHCDVVLTLSKSLAEKKGEIHKNVHWIGQGVRTELIRPSLNVDVPEELNSIPKPRIGFSGTVRDWIDFNLLKNIIEKRPQWSFIFLGPIDETAKKSIKDFKKLRNCYWLGNKSYRELYRWYSGFDVGIIPYIETEFTKYINPAKLYEYWATGLPVITTRIGGFTSIKDCLWVADNSDNFLLSIEDALIGNSVTKRKKRIELAEEYSFDKIAEKALHILFHNEKIKI